MRSVLLIVIAVLAGGTAAVHAATSSRSQPMWASPSAMAVKRVSGAPGMQTRSVTFENIDCTEISYRLAGHGDMREGCFTPTAFGMLDADQDIAIFNGTDEGLALHTNVPHRILAPWPKALNLMALDAADTGGSYINVYKNPLDGLEDERDWKGQLVAKRLAAPPDIYLTDTAGKPLVVNPDSIAFSSGGSWMVVETLSGSFVRINLASLDRLAFAPAFAAAGWPGKVFRSQVAVSEDGRYAAIGNHDDGTLKIYDLTDCSGGGACPAHDYMPFLRQKISGLSNIRELRFINDGLLSFTAASSNGSGIYELAPASSITSLTNYIGLGDSYTSGEGAFDYLAGTDTPDNVCHLSAGSYPLLLSRDLFGSGGGHSVACSGARINDVAAEQGSYRGQVRNGLSLDELRGSRQARLTAIMSGFSPGYVAQNRFVSLYQPRIVSVSIGGNDIGFGDILERCVVPHVSRHHSDENCYNTYESRQEVVDLVDRTVKRWAALYHQLRTESPGSVVYAIGYPSIASDIGKCSINVRLDKNELEFAEELIHYMNASIRQAAVAAGVPYVDIEQALAGHRLCEASGGDVAVNGLTAGNDFGIIGIGLLGHESYHPNALGHQLIEQAILRQTDNLSAGASGSSATVVPPNPPETGDLLDAPKTGRAINTLAPDRITRQQAAPGDTIRLQIDGGQDGLRSGGSYAVYLDGPTGALLGRIVSDPEGNLSGTFTLPGGVEADTHVIDVIGPGQDDRQVDVAQSIYIGPLDDVLNGGEVNGTENPLGTPETPKAPKDKKRPAKQLAARWRGRLPRNFGGLLGAVATGPSFTAPLLGSETPDVIMPLIAGVLFAALAFFGRRIIKSAFCYFGDYCNNWPKKRYKKLRRCFTIVTMRTFGAVVFSVILFASLLVLGFSTSSNSAITNQRKTNSWLSDSNLYGAFVENAISQAEQTAGTDQSGGVSLSDTAVKQAAEQSFSSTVLEKDVNIFLNSNYAWLQGKTAKPRFSVNLSAAKQDFAEKVGKYVTTYLKGLPACTAAQEARVNPQTADPLTLQCLPRGLKPATIGSQVTQQIADSTQFLGDPVITADNMNPKTDGSSMRPYYQRFSTLPSLYQAAVKVPWVAGVVALLSLIAVILIARGRRKSMKIVALVFSLAGLVMVTSKLLTDQAFNSIEKHTFNSSTVGQLQKAITVFLHHVENQIVRVDLWFGISYLLVALGLVLALIVTRKRGLRMPKPLQTLMPSDNGGSGSGIISEPDANDSEPATPTQPAPKPRRPKPPRLVQ